MKKFIKKGTTDRKVPNGIMNESGNVSHPQDMSRQTDLMIDPFFTIFNMNALIYKGAFGNKGFENKKLTLLGVVR